MMNAFSHDCIPCASCRVFPAHLPVTGTSDCSGIHPQTAIKWFNKRVICRLSGAREVHCDAVFIRPSRLFDINSLPLSVWIRTGSRLSGTRSASIILATSSPFNDFLAWIARHSRLKLSTTVSARKRRPLNRLSGTKSILQHWSTCVRTRRCWRRAALTCLRGRFLRRFRPSGQ